MTTFGLKGLFHFKGYDFQVLCLNWNTIFPSDLNRKWCHRWCSLVWLFSTHSLTAVNSRFSRLKTQGKCRNTRRSPSVNRSVNVSKRMFTGVHWIGKLMDNGTNTRINRSENVWKTKDFPLGESQKMRVNCAFFVNSPRVFSVGKCHFFCRVYMLS